MTRKAFDEVVLFARTGLNPRTNFKLGSGNNKYITIKNIHNNRLLIDENTDLVDDAAISLIHKRSQIKKGDILFCSIGRMGDMYIIPDEPQGWDINESVFAFTVDTNLIRQKYFYYLFKNRDTIEYLSKNSSGSTFKSIKMNQLKKMVFELPTLDEQDRIVDSLDLVSSIIEKRENELTRLDELIKARFVEMFGDGDYVKVRLGDVCKKITDGTHKTPNYLEEGITFISAKNIINGKLDFSDVKHISEREYQEIQKRCQTEVNDILLSKSGSLGAPVIVKTEEKLGLFESLAVLKYDRSRFLPEFLCEHLKMDSVQRQFKSGTKGVAIKHLHLGVIADTLVIEPSMDEQNEFADFCKQVDKSKSVVQKSLDEAKLLFDSLMQEYFA